MRRTTKKRGPEKAPFFHREAHWKSKPWGRPKLTLIVFHQQMNMIGGNRIVQELQGEPVASFAQSGYKTMPIMAEFQ
jgi:hypothetical protein